MCVVTIKVPWGQIAGKAWGHSNRRPVLALHGEVLVVFYRIHHACALSCHISVCTYLPLQFLSA